MSSRERNTKLIVQQNNKLASYVSGVGMQQLSGVKSRAGGMGGRNMHPHGYLNRKASEEKF